MQDQQLPKDKTEEEKALDRVEKSPLAKFFSEDKVTSTVYYCDGLISINV